MTTTQAVKTPRPYQDESVEALYADWAQGVLRSAVVLPTGSGKTFIFSLLICEHFRRGGRKVCVIAHRTELIDQAYNAITEALKAAGMTGIRVGIVKAQDDYSDADVVIASIQTLETPRRVQAIAPVDLVIYDELHHSVAKSSLKALTTLGIFQHVRFAGFTATAERGDHVGLGEIVEHVAYQRDITWMIDQGYLIDPEYVEITADTPAELATEYRRVAGARQGIVFCRTKVEAADVAAALSAAGVPAAYVTGETAKDERTAVYDALRARTTQVLVNVGVATEGFDIPQLEVCVLYRGVGSNGLKIQMIGRVLRLADGKTGALVVTVRGKRGARGRSLKSTPDLRTGKVQSEPQAATQSAPAARILHGGAAPAGHQIHLHITKRWFGHFGARVGKIYDHGRLVKIAHGKTDGEIMRKTREWIARLPE